VSRLRLVPVAAERAGELWLVHGDDAVWPSYRAARPTRAEVARTAATMGEAWRWHGVHKWLAYDRASGELVGRGGLSRPPFDDDWGQVLAFLPAEPWARAEHPDPRPYRAFGGWVELGWAVRGAHQGRGYATEIGRAGLAHAWDVLGAHAVVCCAARTNTASRAVIARLGLPHAGEITSAGVPYATHVLTRTDR
jgi:RimJ/RimL family protein N-acetyltransferase